MRSSFLTWVQSGKKPVRLLKVFSVAMVLYWLFKLLSDEMKTAELLLCAVLYALLALFVKYRKVSSRRLANLPEIDQMSGTEFEERILSHFRTIGWKGRPTRASGDYGADLLLRSPDGHRIVAQLKRYNDKVGVSAVQEVVAAIAYYKAHSAMLITNSHLTKNALVLAHANNVEVWQREQLAQQLAAAVQKPWWRWRRSISTME